MTLGKTFTSPMHYVLDVANKGYHNGEMEIHNPTFREGERGDLLADFISQELKDVTYDVGDSIEAFTMAIEAMDRAIAELRDVREALVSEKIDLEDEEGNLLTDEEIALGLTLNPERSRV